MTHVIVDKALVSNQMSLMLDVSRALLPTIDDFKKIGPSKGTSNKNSNKILENLKPAFRLDDSGSNVSIHLTDFSSNDMFEINKRIENARN